MDLANYPPALILIDIQKAFDDEQYWGGSRNNPDAELNARRLLDIWRTNGWPLFHIQHTDPNPDDRLGINNPGHVFKDIVMPLPGEAIIRKAVHSAFIGTDLKRRLDEKGIKTLVTVGLTTDHCVSTTTRMAGNYGYQTFVVADATATFGKTGFMGEYYDGETMHLTALAHLHEEFATVLNTQQLISLLNISRKADGQ